MSGVAWQFVDRLARQLGAEPAGPSPVEREVSALFAELRAPLLRYTVSLGLSAADGEDIVQEVFLSLFRHLQSGKPSGNLRGWTFRVAHHLALKRRTRNGRTAEAGAAAELVDPAPTPEESAALTSASQRLQAIVNALAERDRLCLFLRAEGLRYREIAEALEISLGAVAASLSRSLAKLATAYDR